MIWVGQYVNCSGCGRRMPDIGRCEHDKCTQCCAPCKDANQADQAKYIHEGRCTTSSGVIVESKHCARCTAAREYDVTKTQGE